RTITTTYAQEIATCAGVIASTIRMTSARKAVIRGSRMDAARFYTCVISEVRALVFRYPPLFLGSLERSRRRTSRAAVATESRTPFVRGRPPRRCDPRPRASPDPHPPPAGLIAPPPAAARRAATRTCRTPCPGVLHPHVVPPPRSPSQPPRAAITRLHQLAALR